jgi:hypothetical protein
VIQNRSPDGDASIASNNLQQARMRDNMAELGTDAAYEDIVWNLGDTVTET